MNCELYRTKIEEMNLGEGMSDDTAMHLRACESCAKFYVERDALRALVGGLERVDAPADFDFRLRARMAAENVSRQSRRAAWRFAPGLVSLGVAALFALTLIALRVYQTQPPVADMAQTAPLTGAENPSDVPAPSSHDASKVVAPVENSATTPPRVTQTSELARTFDAQDDETTTASQPRRIRVARTNDASAKSARTASTRGGGATPSDFTASLRGATVVSRESAELLRAAAAKGSVPVAVPVNASAEPLRVVLRDEDGGSRVVAIKSVSFGAQNLVGQRTRAANASLPVSEGVW